jgi:TonB family protein
VKKTALFSIFIFSALFSLNAFAAEKMAMEPISANGMAAANTSNPFSLTVAGDGSLKTTPGELFTAGQEAPGTEMPYLISYSKTISYPRWAVRQGWQGEVLLAVEILENGKVGAAVVMQSAGYAILDKAALRAVKSWKFQPAVLNGKAFRSCVQIPVNFQLRGE